MPEGAIFHMDVKTFSRSNGQSAVAAAAYRAASRLFDARIGIEFDYKRKSGVVRSFIAVPDGCDWITDRNTLWDAAEAAENRKNSTVAREWLVALPDALDEAQREDLTRALATELVTRYGVAVDVAIHKPRTIGDGVEDDGETPTKTNRNHHAHLLSTTREATLDGFDAKTRILDAAKTGGTEIAAMRAWWADMINNALEAADIDKRVDHRRRSVIIAELEAEAKVLKQQAADIDALNSSVTDAGGIVKGLGKAARALRGSGVGVLTAKAEDADQLRAQADELLNQAYRLKATPVNNHDGPQLSAYKRRMEAIWEAEAQAEVNRIAAEKAENDRRAIQAEENDRRAQKARDAALRAAEGARKLSEAREFVAEQIMPVIKRARTLSTLADEIRSWGIDIDRPDEDVARDDRWRMIADDYERLTLWSTLIREAKRLESEEAQKRERQRKADVEAFIASQIERANKFPTPSQRWPYPGFIALEPDSIQRTFRGKYRGRLTDEETTTTIRSMLQRWVERIVEDIGNLKRGVQSIWTSLTNGHHQAASALKRAVQDYPDISKSLTDVLPEPEQLEDEPQAPKSTIRYDGPSGP